jgi:hypothetical protein
MEGAITHVRVFFAKTWDFEVKKNVLRSKQRTAFGLTA